MSKDKGWIKTHRAIMENWVYDNPWTFKAFMHLCMTVNIKENPVNFDGKCYNIQPGQRITSTQTLTAEMKFAWRTTDKVLKQLEEKGMVRIDHIGKAFIVTVVNFKKYQHLCSKAEQKAEVRAEQPLLESRIASAHEQTNKEEEKYKEVKKGAKRPLNPWEGDPE